MSTATANDIWTIPKDVQETIPESVMKALQHLGTEMRKEVAALREEMVAKDQLLEVLEEKQREKKREEGEKVWDGLATLFSLLRLKDFPNGGVCHMVKVDGKDLIIERNDFECILGALGNWKLSGMFPPEKCTADAAIPAKILELLPQSHCDRLTQAIGGDSFMDNRVQGHTWVWGRWLWTLASDLSLFHSLLSHCPADANTRVPTVFPVHDTLITSEAGTSFPQFLVKSSAPQELQVKALVAFHKVAVAGARCADPPVDPGSFGYLSRGTETFVARAFWGTAASQ